MNANLKTGLLIVIAAVAGYLAMVLLITIVQEWIFGGVSYNKSSLWVLALAGLGTFLSALIGGWVAFAINRYQTKISNIIMSIVVVVETSWLLTTWNADNPVWFDVLASGSLILGILLATKLHFLRIRII